MCSVHFGYGLTKLNVKIRAAIVTSINRKVQVLTSAQLSAENFSTGEIVNLMSTDTDRLMNFAESFHACWSMPLQLFITLYLLYLQLGVAALAGFAVIVVFTPINRVLAVKIGKRITSPT